MTRGRQPAQNAGQAGSTTVPRRYCVHPQLSSLRRSAAGCLRPDRLLVFPGAKGGPICRGNFNKMSARPQAVASIGMPACISAT